MANVSWWIVSRALRAGTIGLSLGAIAGLSCLVLGSATDISNLAGTLHWLVIILVPLLVWVVALNDLTGDSGDVYRMPASALGRLLAVGLLGALFANAMFFTLVLNVPIALKSYDALTWRTTLDKQIGSEQYLLAFGIAALGALGAGLWARRMASAPA